MKLELSPAAIGNKQIRLVGQQRAVLLPDELCATIKEPEASLPAVGVIAHSSGRIQQFYVLASVLQPDKLSIKRLTRKELYKRKSRLKTT